MSRPRPVPVLSVALLVLLLAFAWPLLWLWGSHPAMLYGQEADADRLYAAAPAALLGPQKVSGPADTLAGRYLSRAGGLHRWLGRHGFRLTDHTGLGFTPHIRGKRPNVLRAAQPRIFFYSLCSEK